MYMSRTVHVYCIVVQCTCTMYITCTVFSRYRCTTVYKYVQLHNTCTLLYMYTCTYTAVHVHVSNSVADYRSSLLKASF